MRLGFYLTLEVEPIREGGQTSGETKVFKDNTEVCFHHLDIEKDFRRDTKANHQEYLMNNKPVNLPIKRNQQLSSGSTHI